MMLFQRRLLRELVVHAASTFVMLSVVIGLVMTAQVVSRPEGLSLGTVALVVPAMTTAQVGVTVPLAVLVAIVLAYGRAAADNEIDALRCSGVHPLQIGLPGLVFGALSGLVLLFCADYLAPWAEKAQRHYQDRVDIAELVRRQLTSGEVVKLDDDTAISADSIAPDGRALGVRVQMYSDDNEIERELLAESAEIAVRKERNEITLRLYSFRTVRGPRIEGAETEITRALPGDRSALDIEALTTPQLLAELRYGAPLVGFSPREVALAVGMRLSSAVACLLFVLVGMPIALLYRRGDRTGAFLVAFLVALFVYFPSQQVSLFLANREVLSPLLASWAGSLLLLAIGVALCRRVLLR